VYRHGCDGRKETPKPVQCGLTSRATPGELRFRRAKKCWWNFDMIVARFHLVAVNNVVEDDPPVGQTCLSPSLDSKKVEQFM